MKKTLVSALTTALVVGAASTTFAAANPFEDVPADHWAYDAVAQLAADGVIEGYGDGTYRGDQEITRYEMAQMVARAMAKGATGADKAMIDKLAAEFADELNNLGVRVAALEKKVDNVKWGGRLRYRYINRSIDKTESTPTGKRTNQYMLRMEPVMTINEHWVGKARIDYANSRDFATGKNLNGDDLTVDRIYAEGTYGSTKIQLGKFPGYSNADYGMIFAYREAGAKVTFGKDVKVGVSAARLNLANASFLGGGETGPTATHLELEVYNDRSKRFTWGIGYHNLSNKAFFDEDGANYLGNQRANIIDVGLGYKFTNKLGLTAAYAKNTSVDGDAAVKAGASKSSVDQSYNFQLNYGGAVKTKPGSWGAYIAYRHLGQASTIRSDYSELGPILNNERGWEIGASVAPMKNTTLFVKYFMGNKIAGATSGNKVHTFFTELNLWF